MDHHYGQHRQPRNRHGLRAGILAGGSFVLVGLAFLLDRLGLLGPLAAWQLWPLIFVWVGLIKLFSSRESGGRVESIIWIGLGAVLQLYYLDMLPLDWSTLWPLGLIFVGIMVFIATVRRSRQLTRKPRSTSFLDGFVIFGGREDQINSTSFTGGELFCVMGGFELDLRQAELQDDKAVLNIKVFMGGVELKVPEHWQVIIRGAPIMGGFENKTRPIVKEDAPTPPQLIIEGLVVMGGVEVRN